VTEVSHFAFQHAVRRDGRNGFTETTFQQQAKVPAARSRVAQCFEALIDEQTCAHGLQIEGG
jgi:hypothetical protein